MYEVRISPDPRAWARKYFTAASVSCFVFLAVIRGIRERRFSSKEAHMIMKLLEEMIIIVLLRRVVEKRVRCGRRRDIL